LVFFLALRAGEISDSCIVNSTSLVIESGSHVTIFEANQETKKLMKSMLKKIKKEQKENDELATEKWNYFETMLKKIKKQQKKNDELTMHKFDIIQNTLNEVTKQVIRMKNDNSHLKISMDTNNSLKALVNDFKDFKGDESTNQTMNTLKLSLKAVTKAIKSMKKVLAIIMEMKIGIPLNENTTTISPSPSF